MSERLGVLWYEESATLKDLKYESTNADSESHNVLRDGILTKILAPSRPGITGQWLGTRKYWLAKGLSVSHSLDKRPLDHQTDSLIGVFK